METRLDVHQEDETAHWLATAQKLVWNAHTREEGVEAVCEVL